MKPVFVVFDGPPNRDSGRFVEVETADGKSVVNVDFPWTEHGDYWHLGPFFTADQLRAAQIAILREAAEKFDYDCECGVPCDCYGPVTAKFQLLRMADELEKSCFENN